MKRFLQWLLSPVVIGTIGLLALSALVWWVGPLVAIGSARPLDPLAVRITVLVLLWALWIGWQGWKAWKRRKTNAALLAGLAAGPSAATKEAQVLAQRFNDAVARLKASGGKGSLLGGGQFLYELPWYIFIGAPGSGKTTALMNAGLQFLLGDAGQGRGAGRGRHAQLRVVVHAGRGADRHRRPLRHAGERPRRRCQRLGQLPRAAEEDTAAPADQRRAAHRQRPGPAAARRHRTPGARRQAARAAAGTAEQAGRARAGLRAGHQGRPDRRLQRELRGAGQGRARPGLGLHLRARHAAGRPAARLRWPVPATAEAAGRATGRRAWRPSATCSGAARSSPSRRSSRRCRRCWATSCARCSRAAARWRPRRACAVCTSPAARRKARRSTV